MRMWVCLGYTALVIGLLARGKGYWVAVILTLIMALMFSLFLSIVLEMANKGQLNANE